MLPDLNWLENPEIFRVNRLNAHSDHICYAAPEETESSLRQSLDGSWRFAFSENPASRPADFWQEGYDLSAFGTITVPGHIQTQGFGQIQYTNKLYPWDGHAELRPPHIDWENNHVGSYVREFDLAPGLVGREVCVSFQGVEAAFYLWCNGHFVGYSEDSFTPADFDLTPYIQKKGNRLCVEVYQRCSGSWLEDQDFFRFSGIFRPVYLYAKPLAEDLWIQSTLHEDLTSGDVRFRLKLTKAAKVHAKISHETDGILFDGDLELTPQGDYCFSQTLAFPNVRLWDYGTPELYHVLLTVIGDEITEYIPYDFGFRRFEMGQDKIMYLNGKRLMINGVNRHEWHCRKGRAIDTADMEAAMETILANNINAVRTCHYPNRTEWYHMCDQKGIYMMDETNLETHGSWQKDALPDSIEPSWNIPASLPEWRENVLDRANSMFQRDKNHVSILFWSCGNAIDETGHDHHAGAVDDGSRLLLGRNLGNGRDLAVLNAKERAEQNVHFFIHGHDRDIGNQGIHYRLPFISANISSFWRSTLSIISIYCSGNLGLWKRSIFPPGRLSLFIPPPPREMMV